jgi:uncharacterized protein
MLNLNQIKKNPYIQNFIGQAEKALAAIGYTEHGLSHCTLVAARARNIAREIGLSKKDQELTAIAGFCHDIGNFLSRDFHHYLGAMLFYQTFKDDFSPEEISSILHAISNHDKKEMEFYEPMAAVVVLADKSDVRRTRVLGQDLEKIKEDIHDRVNYATRLSKLGINKKKKVITLTLKIDTDFVPVMEYFEIFTERMVYCRQAANFLGYKFGLVINNFKLL